MENHIIGNVAVEPTEPITARLELPVSTFVQPVSNDADWVLDAYDKEPFSWKSLLPPLTWFPRYIRAATGQSTDDDILTMGNLRYSVRYDMIAGLTVGILLVPQCLAFALLAGLPVEVGLYSSFAPLLMYSVLGTIRQLHIGPTAVMSLLTGSALDELGFTEENMSLRVECASLLALLTGLITLMFAVLRCGFLIDFMAHPVMSAFCTAAGITILTSQLKHIFGIVMERKSYWWETLGHLVTHLDETDGATFSIGAFIFLMIWFFKCWKGAGKISKRQSHRFWRYFPTGKRPAFFKAFKLLADMSTLLAVIIGYVGGFVFRKCGVYSVKLVGTVESNGFTANLPENIEYRDFNFGTALSTAFIMAVVGFLETIAVGGKFAAANRYTYDANQELVGIGASNVLCGFMGGYPITGSFSRTAVQAMFGGTSLITVAISSLLVLVANYALLDVIKDLPLACFAPVIIHGAITVIDVYSFRITYESSRGEFFVMMATLGVSLGLTVKEGLIVGFIVSILCVMYELGNPNLAICGRVSDGDFRDLRNFPAAKQLPNALVVRCDSRLSFANVRKIMEFCSKALEAREAFEGEKMSYLIFDAKSINRIDITACEQLEKFVEVLSGQGQKLIFANLKAMVADSLVRAGMRESLEKHDGALCIDMEGAVSITQGCLTKTHQINLDRLLKRTASRKMLMRRAHGSEPKGDESPWGFERESDE